MARITSHQRLVLKRKVQEKLNALNSERLDRLDKQCMKFANSREWNAANNRFEVARDKLKALADKYSTDDAVMYVHFYGLTSITATLIAHEHLPKNEKARELFDKIDLAGASEDLLELLELINKTDLS